MKLTTAGRQVEKWNEKTSGCDSSAWEHCVVMHQEIIFPWKTMWSNWGVAPLGAGYSLAWMMECLWQRRVGCLQWLLAGKHNSCSRNPKKLLPSWYTFKCWDFKRPAVVQQEDRIPHVTRWGWDSGITHIIPWRWCCSQRTMRWCCCQVSKSLLLWTLAVLVSLRSFWWEMPQKLFLQPGIARGEGSVQAAVPWGWWCDKSGDEEGFLAINHVTRSGAAPSFCSAVVLLGLPLYAQGAWSSSHWSPTITSAVLKGVCPLKVPFFTDCCCCLLFPRLMLRLAGMSQHRAVCGTLPGAGSVGCKWSLA